MTETMQTPNASPTDSPASCPECSKLLAFAELDEMIVAGVSAPEQIRQHDELARELSGNPESGEAVAAVLARALAEARHRSTLHMRLADDLARKFDVIRKELLRERLEKDPCLASLPSGRKVSIRNVMDFERFGESAHLRYASGQMVMLEKAEDIAALDAALTNIGVAANAPTIAGEDRDGDGRTGE